MRTALARLVLITLAASCDALLGASHAKLAPRNALAPRPRTPTTLAYTEYEPQDTWWGDKDAPPSIVLGVGKDVPSQFYAVTSGLALALGLYCVAESNLFNVLSGSTVNGAFVAGSLLVPYSWGLHVASWIQRMNGK